MNSIYKMSKSSMNSMSNSNWVNKQLEAYGSRTSGSLEQRQQRLQRFIDNNKTAPPAPPAPPAPRKSRKQVEKINYEPLRILAAVAAEYDNGYSTGEQEEESEYEPSTEGEDDDISLAPTEDLEQLNRHEHAIHDTWHIYLESTGSTKDRALDELQQLIDELKHLRSMS